MNPTGVPTLLAAFAVGFISFVSPCVLPLVPGYLSAISPAGSIGKRRKTLAPALVFCATFSTVFIALGLTASQFGSLIESKREAATTVAGVLVVVLGVIFALSPFTRRFSRQLHIGGLMKRAGSGGPIIAGAAFALAWTPCVGPTLGAILAVAAVQVTAVKGATLLVAYSAGLAIPFLLCAVAMRRVYGMLRLLRNNYAVISVVSGLVLCAMGWLMITGEMVRLNSAAQRLLESVGINFASHL